MINITDTEFGDFADAIQAEEALEKGFFTNKYGYSLNEKYWLGAIAKKENLLYCKLAQSFFHFRDGLWSIRTKAEVREIVDGMIRDAVPRNSEVYKELDRLLRLKELTSLADRLAGHQDIVKEDPFSKAPLGVVLFENGRLLIDYENAEVKFQPEHPGCPKDYKTYRLPIRYNPNAEAVKTKQWLEEMFSHEGDREAIKKMLGVCLWGSNEWKKMIYCYGEADIGKTQLSHLVSNLIGQSKTVSFTSKQLSNRFEMRRLVGKVFVLASDVEANFMCLEGTSDVFKQMVGRDPIRVETKFRGEEHYMLGDKMVFACSNFTARVRALGDASAWRSRLVLINADGKAYRDGEADTRFVHKLFEDREEASGIVNLAIEGLLQILNDRHWARTSEQMERLEQVLSENQAVNDWARDAITVGDFSEEHVGVTSAEAWASYVRWTEAKGLQPWSERIFQELATDAIQCVFGKNKSHNLHRGPTAHRGWRGLSLIV